MNLKNFLIYKLLKEEILDDNKLVYLYKAIDDLSKPNIIELKINDKQNFLNWINANLTNFNNDQISQIDKLINLANLIRNKKLVDITEKAFKSIQDYVVAIFFLINEYGRLAKNNEELKIISKRIKGGEISA